MSLPASACHLSALHARFLSLLPRIKLHGRVYFRHVHCPHRKAELLQEMRSLAWKWFVRLHQRGRDANEFVGAFATLLAKAVNAGRKVTGGEKGKDVMNALAQRRFGFAVEPMMSTRASFDRLYSTPHGQDLQDAFEDRLRDNTVTPIPEQVQFRIDWPAWVATLTPRERKLIELMACGERTQDLSKQFEVSEARISQLRSVRGRVIIDVRGHHLLRAETRS